MNVARLENGKRIFAFSDTHGQHHKLTIPENTEILVCAGDAVEDCLDPEDYRDFLDWFEAQPGKYKIFVPGEHERIFEVAPKWGGLMFRDRNIFLGNNRVIDCGGTTFYCMIGNVIPEEGLELMKTTDFFVTHYPVEQLLPDVTIEPNAVIFGHDHQLGSGVCLSSVCPMFSVSKYEVLAGENQD